MTAGEYVVDVLLGCGVGEAQGGVVEDVAGFDTCGGQDIEDGVAEATAKGYAVECGLEAAAHHGGCGAVGEWRDVGGEFALPVDEEAG